MLLGTDQLTILRGSKFYGTWQWVNSVTGDAEDFAGLTATIKIKNIHEDFESVKNTYEVGTVIIEPLDNNNSAIKGRVDISLSKEDTLKFAIPENEEDRYGESGFYSILEILLSTGEIILQAKVWVVESLEAETLNFLLDEKDEAIIINGKLDEILLKKNEYIATRDNLINVVIPTALLTYNENHDEKMGVYNNNDTSKTDIYNQNHATKLQEVNILASNVQTNKDLVDQAKANVFAMKEEVQGNKESVALMKTAIETMLDNFDDRFLGQKDSDPILDNDGNPLQIAAIYYNNSAKELKFYNGVSWDSPVTAAQTYALQASQYAMDALASKNAAKTSEDNAKLSEQNTAIATDIHTKTEKMTLSDADEIAVADSDSFWSLKKITYAKIKSTLKSYFDNLYTNKVASTDNAVVLFNGTTGEVRNSNIIIDDSNNIFGVNSIFLGSNSSGNQLDDYEEGTFTPTIKGSTIEGEGIYTFQYGTYTKIGRLVQFSLYVGITSHTGTGNLVISGLPFIHIAGNIYTAVTLSNLYTLTFTGTQVNGYIAPNTNNINLSQSSSGSTTSSIAMDTSFRLMVSGTYPTN
jgi:hypothetical protein